MFHHLPYLVFHAEHQKSDFLANCSSPRPFTSLPLPLSLRLPGSSSPVCLRVWNWTDLSGRGAVRGDGGVTAGMSNPRDRDPQLFPQRRCQRDLPRYVYVQHLLQVSSNVHIHVCTLNFHSPSPPLPLPLSPFPSFSPPSPSVPRS